MSKNNKKDIPMWAKTGHSKPVSRRDFLAAGVLPFAASIFVPNWASLLLGSSAQAAGNGLGCALPETLIPVVTVNLSGGAALASNFVPMNAAGEPIATYSKLGLGDNQVPLEKEFGNVPFAGMDNGVLISKFLVGLRANAAAATLANTAFVGIPVESQNDTAANKLDISGLVTKAGLVGTNLPNLGRSGTTGINQAPAFVAPPSPLIVSSFTAITSSIGYTAALGTSLNATQRGALSKLMRDLNTTQARKLASIKGAEDVKTVLDCAGIKNVDVIANGAGIVDPRQNAAFSQVWGFNMNTAPNNAQLIAGSMVYNSLLGQAGSSNINIGGYDYHDNTRTSGDNKDNEAGVMVGRILQSAAVLQKPVFIYVVSDGSVYSQDSQMRNAPWAGDRGSNGVAYIMYYDPKGRPETSGFQIGHFTDNQGADTSFITGGNPELAGAAAFANWCAANKRMDLLEKVASRAFDTASLAKVLKIA